MAALLALSSRLSAQAPERVRPNDNQARAGITLAGQLAVRMEARMATWYPDGEDRPGIQIPAFAEVGRPAQVPGPLIRARGGTDVVVIVRNLIPNAWLTIHGLHARPAIAPAGMTFTDSIVIAPGAVQTVRFRLDRPGTYYYWGTITGQPFATRMHEDAQLTGAIVVDEPGERTPRDRILVLGMLTDTTRSDSLRRRQRELVVVNGRSWPTTDRLQYEKGDVVRWRVINASVDAHSMHLHGFFYRVLRRGDAMADTALMTRAELVNTERVAPGATFSAQWVADRLGNWIFHCEEPEHSSQRGPLGYPPPYVSSRSVPTRGLGGLVAGIEIARAEEDTTWKLPPPPVPPATRNLRLVLRPGIGSMASLPIYGVEAIEGGVEPLPYDTGQRVGPTLLLNRGEQTSVTVVNNLPEATSIHWHGMEVESLYDGVPGFSGVKPIPIKGEPPPTTSPWAPLLAPGDSFEVRLAPPRVGTFAYHAAVSVERQQRAGIVGAIVVSEKGKFDATRDFAVLYSSPIDSAAEEAGVLVNGVMTPPALDLRRATAYRLRLLNFTTGRPDLSIELKQDSTLAGWRLIARDGAELVAADRMLVPARMPLAVGQTRDVEFLPLRVGEYRLEARTPAGLLLSTLILRVN